MLVFRLFLCFHTIALRTYVVYLCVNKQTVLKLLLPQG